MARKNPDEKRTPSNTADARTQLMEDALQPPLAPPKHCVLRPRDLPFWESVVRARARSLWNDADLELAANLARCKSDIELQQQLLNKEGYVIKNKRETPIANPRTAVLEVLSRRAVALSRMLQVHAGATIGDARDARALREAEEAARDADQRAKENPDNLSQPHDDLIPSPPPMH